MNPENKAFFLPNLMRFVNLDQYSNQNINYPTAQYFDKNGQLNSNMTWLLAKNRKHKMFIRKCSTDIEPYEECLGNKNWRINPDHMIEESLQRKCYTQWVKVRRCADKWLGKQFRNYLDITRETNIIGIMEADRDSREYYKRLHQRKLELFGPDHLVPSAEEGGEEAEGEEEEE